MQKIYIKKKTGTGKTHTMFGDWENEFNKGIVPLALAQIFQTIEKDSEYSYKLTLSCIQIYMEMVYLFIFQ